MTATLPRRLALLAALFSLATLPGCKSKPAWQVVSYPTEGFRASFPTQPKLQKKYISVDADILEVRMYVAETQDDEPEGALMVGVADSGPGNHGLPDVQLDNVRNLSLAAAHAHLIGEKKIALGAWPGRATESESDTIHFSARSYLAGDVLYQTLVVTQRGVTYRNTARFLDSFQVIPRVTK